MPNTYTVVRDDDPHSLHNVVRRGPTGQVLAHDYRLRQGRELLAEAGFIEHPDGTWHPPAA